MNYQTLSRVAFSEAAHFVERQAALLDNYSKPDLTDMIAALLRFSAAEVRGQRGNALLNACRRHVQKFLLRIQKHLPKLAVPALRLMFQMDLVGVMVKFNDTSLTAFTLHFDTYTLATAAVHRTIINRN